MKKKFLCLAFVAIVVTITGICFCGFAPKFKDISDEEMNNVVFGADDIIQPRFITTSSVPYDTLELAVDHTVERGFPGIPTYGYSHGMAAAAIANAMAYAARNVPQIVSEGIVYLGGNSYDSNGQAAKNLMINVYNSAGLSSGQGTTYENLSVVQSRMANDRGCLCFRRNVARYGTEVLTEGLDRAMVEFNYPLHVYVDAAEIVTNYVDNGSALTFYSNMIYGNQVYSGYSYQRYRIVKDGVIHDEYLITVKDENGSDKILRLGGNTSIYRIYATSFVL